MIKVICSNNKNRPDGIPLTHWIEEGKEYTVIDAIICNTQGGVLGYKLAEIDLTPFAPYITFGAWRFKRIVDTPKLEAIEELVA